jgi:hypothetical protein
MYVPNRSMPLNVPLGKVIFFHYFINIDKTASKVRMYHEYDSIPNLEVRCYVASCGSLQSATHSNFQVSCFTDHSVLIRVILKQNRLTNTNKGTCANSAWGSLKSETSTKYDVKNWLLRLVNLAYPGPRAIFNSRCTDTHTRYLKFSP